ncbi:MAG TPA: dienelactone hydrolase family protein [Acidimicrobiia bacterium]|nr:dienelactone hydrolase family protein [Acidimicrobiia bacterium]
MTGALDGFSESAMAYGGLTRTVYRGGSGPAVIVIEEIPGITPEVEAFARRVIDAGFTAVLPSLFGTPGKPFSVPYTISSIARVCVAREFLALKLDATAPVIGWLRRLAREAHAECGGPGVGVVGMCFTGGFALGMMIDDEILAPVLSQPAVPFPFGRARRAALGISDDDLARVKERVANGACVLGLRFTADRSVPAERFETLRRELGDGFIAVEIDSSPGNAFGIKKTAHSVVTNDLVDEPGHPTRVALDRVLAFLRERLEVTDAPRPAVDD